MLGTILIGLLSWTIASVVVGLVVGKVITMSSQPVPVPRPSGRTRRHAA
jgi:hypothetical protein